MPAPITDWDDAYANGAYIPSADAYPPRWQVSAAEFRNGVAARARIDVPYGATARERFDLFLPAEHPNGLLVFVHGGYWRTFSKDDWSHFAAGGLARGWAVAMPSYTLCPEVRIHQITRQIAAAVTAIAAEVPGPILLAGHSAGGHLASRMVCGDTKLDSAILGRLQHVVSISGVHDLRPLLRTEINTDLRLDASEAVAESPALHAPVEGIPVTCWVGADERPEFVRQNALLANIWTGLGGETCCVSEPGRHHFDVIDGLADPESQLMRALFGS